MSETKKVALCGGSFDPPHIAHVLTVAYGLSACPVDEVWMLPVWRHAFDKALTSYEHRRNMLSLALEPFGSRVSICDVERERGGVSRTIDTVRLLMQRHPEYRFSLLMGTDLFAERDRWKAFDELERLVDMHVLGRSGHPDPSEVPVGPHLPAVSSTDVRSRVRNGGSLHGLVPLAVARYIERHALYRS